MSSVVSRMFRLSALVTCMTIVYRCAVSQGGRLNRISRLVARLTHFGSAVSLLTPKCLLGARRVVHEMRASVFVARTVLGAAPSRLQSCDCCGTSSCSGTGINSRSRVNV